MMSFKKTCIAAAFFVLIFIGSVVYCEASGVTEQVFVTVKVNDNCIKMDTLPYIKDGRTFVSVRFVAEALGADVEWVDEEKKVIITRSNYDDIDWTIVGAVYAKENGIIELFVGSNEMVVGGEKKLMDTAVEITNGRTMVPIRFISENLDCDVKWDKLTYSVLISQEGTKVPEAYIENRSYNDEDIIWLARIVHVEGRGTSINCKLAIANVVLNRTKSPRFPNTVYDVIFDNDYTVQFPPAYKEGFRETVPTEQCVIAAKMALEGINNIENCLFFNHVPFKSKKITFYKRIDGEYFYY